MASRRPVSSITSWRNSPRPSTPSVSPILRSMPTCDSSSAGWPPRRTKMSSTSLTLPRSSRIAADTVRMSFTDGRGEILALLLDRVVDHQQFVEPERGAHRGHLRTIAGGARRVIQKIVQQLDRRVLRVAPLALRVELQDLAIGEAHQPLDRNAGLEAAFAQRFDNGADHPPELEHRLPGGNLLELVRDGFEDFEVLLRDARRGSSPRGRAGSACAGGAPIAPR